MPAAVNALPPNQPPLDRDNPRSPLPPLRFSLRTLLLVITMICALLGLSHWVSVNVLTVVLGVLLVIGAHVIGNALGTRLRDGLTPQHLSRETTTLEQHAFAPITHLSAQRSLRTTILISSGSGILLGMLAGYYGMLAIYPEHLTGLALVLTLLAFGILGGVAAFLLGTFFRMLWIALSQSHSHK